MHCCWVFFVFNGTFFFFSLKNFVLTSPCWMQSTLRIFEFDMYSNVKFLLRFFIVVLSVMAMKVPQDFFWRNFNLVLKTWKTNSILCSVILLHWIFTYMELNSSLILVDTTSDLHTGFSSNRIWQIYVLFWNTCGAIVVLIVW